MLKFIDSVKDLEKRASETLRALLAQVPIMGLTLRRS